MDDETNPGDPPEVELEQDEAEQGSTVETDADNPEGETEEDEPETIEIERDGKTYKVPAALKDDLLRHGDYTRKTQEIAEARKALETARESVQQAGEAEINAKARSVAMDAAIKQYEGVDWDALQAQDPGAAFQHWRKFQQLQGAKAEADTEYQTAVEARTFETERETASRLEQGAAELARDIPDWGPQKAEQLLSFGEKQFGLTRAYMEGVTDVNLIKVMNFAFLAAKANPSKIAPAAPKPAAKVKGGTAPLKGVDDRLSSDDWLKARNAQVRNRA